MLWTVKGRGVPLLKNNAQPWNLIDQYLWYKLKLKRHTIMNILVDTFGSLNLSLSTQTLTFACKQNLLNPVEIPVYIRSMQLIPSTPYRCTLTAYGFSHRL